MPDAYTGTAAMVYDQAAFDLTAWYALRPQLYFDQCADVKATRQNNPGSTVNFNITADFSAQTTTLNESTDVDAVAASDGLVTLTLLEKGGAMISTAKLRGTSFIEFDPIAANLVGYVAGLSMDTLAREILGGGSNVRFAGQAVGRTTVIPTDKLTAANVRRALAELRGANVMDFNGLYVAYIHPDVEYDLRGETGAAAWRDPHTYSEPGRIWNGTTGDFEGFRFISTSRGQIVSDAGSSTTLTDVYLNLFMGRQALAVAHSYTDGNGRYPRVRPGPVTDKLWRNVPLGWYWLGVHGRFREAALRRVESASTIGANT